MIVAVNVNARLSEVVLDNALKYGFQLGALFFIQRVIQVPGYLPFRKQTHLAHQQRFVVRRQFIFAAGQLDAD